MDHYIKQYSTEPILKMRLVETGRYDFSEFYDRLLDATITFSMKKDGVFKIYKHNCGVVPKINVSNTNSQQYYIYYKWSADDVDEKGKFEGEFEIKFYDHNGQVESTLIAPIREKLYINVI